MTLQHERRGVKRLAQGLLGSTHGPHEAVVTPDCREYHFLPPFPLPRGSGGWDDAWKSKIRSKSSGMLYIRCSTTSAKHVNNATGHLTPFPPDSHVYTAALSWRFA